MNVSAIIAAGGAGRRFGSQEPKQFMNLLGRPIISWSIEAFSKVPYVREMVIVVPASHRETTREILEELSLEIPVRVVIGGASRQESVWNGLSSVSGDMEWVAVHDAARPGVTPEQVEEVCLMAREIGAAILAVPAHDTVKLVDRDGLIVRTLDRSEIMLAQTPQVARRDDLAAAYRFAEKTRLRATDEASLLEAAGKPVGVVEGGANALKITTGADLRLLEIIKGS